MAYRDISRRLQRAMPFLGRAPGARGLARSVRYLIDGAFRDESHLRLFHDEELFQATGHTWFGRYPHLFACLADRLAGEAEPRILSFGCSTGEEVAMLRKAVPRARITGMDISARNLRLARRRFADPNIAFVRASRVEQAVDGPLDAIMCMAVLQRSELTELRPQDCSAYLTFDKFERAILDIDRHLRPGGLLALHHTNFRLADTRVGGDYEPILCSLPRGKDRARYGPDNRLVTGRPDGREILFVKRCADA